MMGRQGDVIAALIAAMAADGAAGVVLGDPVRIWDQVPQGAAFPYVQIGACESRSLGADAGAVEHLVVLNCVSRFAGGEEARAVAGLVEAALEGVVIEGLVSCEVRSVEVRRTADQARAFAVMRVRVVVD